MSSKPGAGHNAFTELNILSDTAQFAVRHPIKRDETIRGKHIAHTPSFSQRNGSLHVYEAIDFTAKKPKLIRERAGWMAYMYTDIKQQEQDAKTYSIYRPSQEGAGEIVEYAQKMLGGESGLINWANDNERNRFLTERQRLAESLETV